MSPKPVKTPPTIEELEALATEATEALEHLNKMEYFQPWAFQEGIKTIKTFQRRVDPRTVLELTHQLRATGEENRSLTHQNTNISGRIQKLVSIQEVCQDLIQAARMEGSEKEIRKVVEWMERRYGSKEKTT
jgi:hypothetical protein